MKKQLLFFCAVLCSFIAIGQQQLVFTPAGAVGKNGPTQAQVNTAYSSTPLNGKVFVKNGIQKWVVPQTGYYRIQTLGAQGYGPFGGRGASMTGEFILTGGDTLKILVGQTAGAPVGSVNQYGGGGGSFVTTRTNTPLIVSGGGGGSWATAFTSTTDASVTNTGNTGANGPTNGAGGTAGSGGATAASADGGAGLLGNGGGTGGGIAFINGGTGGEGTSTGHGVGGFGGGGGTNSWDNRRSGGGGGYSGGGAAGSTTTGFPEGGGGGSYNSGTNPVALAGVQLGDGQVIITPMSSGMANDLALVAVDAPKNFCAGTRNVVVTIQNFGTNTITTGTVNWRINGVAQTPFSYSGTLNSISGSGPISAQVTLGSYNFLAGVPYTIKVWTSLPNGVADPVNANDTMTVVRTSGLIAPTGLTVNGTTGTTASLSWNPMGGAGYVIEYGPVGFTLGTGIRKTGTGTSRTLTGLSPITNYEFYLADSCGVNDIGTFSAAVPFATGCMAPVSGIYTLNNNIPASATNFDSFSQLAFALNTCGVSGPTIVNVDPLSGPYTDQFLVTQIAGASSTNTIIINGNGATLDYTSTNTALRATVILDGADWLTIDSLNITASATLTSEYGFGVTLTNNANHNTIKRCNITVDASSTSTNFAGLNISGSKSSATLQGASGSFNTIENNVITGGYYGVTSVGIGSDSTNFNVIKNNIIKDYYYYGMYNYYNDHFVVEGNDISRPNRTNNSATYFMYNYGVKSGRIVGNRLHDPFPLSLTTTSAAYGIYLAQIDGSNSDPSVIANNIIYNMKSDGTMYGIYPSTMTNTKLINNTVVFDNSFNSGITGITRAFYVIGTLSGCDISNNVVYMNRMAGGTSTVMYFSATLSSTVIDNNAYYAPNGGTSEFGYFGGVSVNNFAGWQAATGAEMNSAFTNPYFINLANADFTPQSAVLDASGKNYGALNTVDINGAPRGIKPDLGAIEFTAAPCTGLSQIGVGSTSPTSGTVVWAPNPAAVTIEWGPVGFKQASQTGTIINVPLSDTSAVISGLGSNSCYDYYLSMNCTSPLPGAPPVMGPFTFCTDCASGPLSGTFTVGGTVGPTNFPTLDSAVSTINGCGINGPVVLNLQGGVHNAVAFGAVSGSSAINTITINGSPNLGDTILAKTGQVAAIDLNGTAHVNVNGVFVINTVGNYVVWLHNEAQHINFQSCYLLGSGVSTSTLTAVVSATSSATTTSGTGINARHISIDDCNISGNGYGVNFYGPGTTGQVGDISITNNRFSNQYTYGIRLYYVDSVMVSGNSIPGFRSSTAYGVYSYYSNNIDIVSNELYGAGTYGVYFYYSNYSGAASGSKSSLINNMIQCSGSAGIYAYGNKDSKFYHNSIQGGTLYGMYMSGPVNANYANNDIRNNIISMTGTGHAMYIATEPTNLTLSYNLYNSGGNIGYSGGTSYATLAGWLAANNAINQNSVQGAPGFVSNSDFHVLGVTSNDIGDNSVGVTTDIDGDPRPILPLGTVDIGADEYTPKNCIPAGNFSVVSVTDSSAVLSWDTITGAQSYLVQYGVNGFTLGQGTMLPATGNTVTINGLPKNNLLYQAYILVNCGADSSIWAGPIPINIKPTKCTDGFEAYNNGIIAGQSTLFKGWAGVAGDGTVSTAYARTGTKSMRIYDSGPNTFTDIIALFDTVNSGVWNLEFAIYVPAGGSGGYYNLQQNYVGGGVGNLWAIEVYLSSAGVARVEGGTNFAGTVGSFNYTVGQWNMFQHIIDFNNDTAWMLLNNNNVNLGWQYTFGSATPTQINGVNFYSATDPGQTQSNYYVDDFCMSPYTPPVCKAPTGLAVNTPTIGCDSVEVSWTSNISNNSVLEYGPNGFTPGTGTFVPFVTSPHVITGLTPGTIYQFYVADTCANGDTSQIVGPINFTTKSAPVAKASFTHSSTFISSTQVITFNGSGSTNADTYTWDFGNGNSGSGATPPAEVYGLPNTAVSVKLTVTNKCGSTDDTTIVINTRIGLEEPEFAKTLFIYPNPSDGIYNLSFNKPSGGSLGFEVLDASGKLILVQDLGTMGGKYEGLIDLSKYAQGVYILRINSDLGTVNRRLTKF